MTNSGRVSYTLLPDTIPGTSKEDTPWMSQYRHARRRQLDCTRRTRTLRLKLLKQQETELAKYRRGVIPGSPTKSTVKSLTVSKSKSPTRKNGLSSPEQQPKSPSPVSASVPNNKDIVSSSTSSSGLKWPRRLSAPLLRNPRKIKYLTRDRSRNEPDLESIRSKGMFSNALNVLPPLKTRRKEGDPDWRSPESEQEVDGPSQGNDPCVSYRLFEWKPQESLSVPGPGNVAKDEEQHGDNNKGRYYGLYKRERERKLRERVTQVDDVGEDRDSGTHFDVGSGDACGDCDVDGDGCGTSGGDGSDETSHHGDTESLKDMTRDDRGGSDSSEDGETDRKDDPYDSDRSDEVGQESAQHNDDFGNDDFDHDDDVMKSESESDERKTNHSTDHGNADPSTGAREGDGGSGDLIASIRELAKWYERYPSTPVIYWQQDFQDTLPAVHRFRSNEHR